MNKFYFFGVIAVLGIFGTSLGAWAKITHQSYADSAITVGLIFRTVGLAALVFIYVAKKEKLVFNKF